MKQKLTKLRRRYGKKGPGRPTLPEGQAKASVIALRVTSLEHEELVFAAQRAGVPLSEWVRATLLSAARATGAASEPDASS